MTRLGGSGWDGGAGNRWVRAGRTAAAKILPFRLPTTVADCRRGCRSKGRLEMEGTSRARLPGESTHPDCRPAAKPGSDQISLPAERRIFTSTARRFRNSPPTSFEFRQSRCWKQAHRPRGNSPASTSIRFHGPSIYLYPLFPIARFGWTRWPRGPLGADRPPPAGGSDSYANISILL